MPCDDLEDGIVNQWRALRAIKLCDYEGRPLD